MSSSGQYQNAISTSLIAPQISQDDMWQVKGNLAGGANALGQANNYLTNPNLTSPSSNMAANNQGTNAALNSANTLQGVANGTGPNPAALQMQQGQDQAMRAIQSTALSNQGGLAPGATQRNLLDAQAQAQQGIVSQGQINAANQQIGAAQAAGGIANQAGSNINQGASIIGSNALGQAGLVAQNAGQQAQFGLGAANTYSGLLQANQNAKLNTNNTNQTGAIAQAGDDINQQAVNNSQANYQDMSGWNKATGLIGAVGGVAGSVAKMA